MTTTAAKDNGYEAFGKLVLALLLMAIAAVVSGLVLSRLWAWFVADTFGVQHLTIAQAIGLGLVARFLFTTKLDSTPEKSFGALMAEGLMKVVVYNGWCLLVGLVVVQFT